jgi:hypothetical protein
MRRQDENIVPDRSGLRRPAPPGTRGLCAHTARHGRPSWVSFTESTNPRRLALPGEHPTRGSSAREPAVEGDPAAAARQEAEQPRIRRSQPGTLRPQSIRSSAQPGKPTHPKRREVSTRELHRRGLQANNAQPPTISICKVAPPVQPRPPRRLRPELNR